MGNKTTLASEIQSFIYENAGDDFGIFCDLFSGTGIVGSLFKKTHSVIANDIMRYAYVLTFAQLKTHEELKFLKLGFDPFVYLNNEEKIEKGFFYKNYAPEHSTRMYFSAFNASRIDFIRLQLEKWFQEKKINETEYNYLIAVLIESVSKVANVAGVYGAYMKKWDPRALKKITLYPLPLENEYARFQNRVYNEDSLSLIEKISGGVLYIDTPYTKNDYSTQYHILETLVRYDNPKISGITGTRPDKKRSIFSEKVNAYSGFEKIVAEAKFKYIVISYSSNGLVEKEFIEKLLKKYGKPESYKFKKIIYRKYRNHRAEVKVVDEYLFFIEKKEREYIESPLNYMGSKFGIIKGLIDFMEPHKKKMVDVFCGGYNVGINYPAQSHVANDYNHFLVDLLKMIKNTDVVALLSEILSKISKNKLAKRSKGSFVSFREKYNAVDKKNRSLVNLYLLLQFGFQQQFRFNSKHEFNNTSGMSGFNLETLIKLLQFSREIKKQKVSLISKNFDELDIEKGVFYYCDPPYLITLGSYNDGKRGFDGWGEKEEKRLYEWLDLVHKKKAFFVLSNVIEFKGKENIFLKAWLKKNKDYRVEKIKFRNRIELMIKNY